MLTAEQSAFLQAVDAGLRARESDFLRLRLGQHGRPGEALARLPIETREALRRLRSEDVGKFNPPAWLVRLTVEG